MGADRTIPTIAPDSTGDAVYTWTYPDGASQVRLTAAADPGDAILEGNETNNLAERDVAAFDSTSALTNAYISPDGDGVQDSTVYSFTLTAPATVSVEAVDDRGRVVRRHGGPELTGVVKGRFEWDGRDDGGLVVDDGAYHLRAVSEAGGILDEVLVTVDTDRWPLSEAIGTPFERISNLTCSHYRASAPQFVGDEGTAYFLTTSGIYRVPAGGGSLTRVVQASYPETLLVSGDGKKMAYDPSIGTDAPLAVANTDGSDRQLISWGTHFGLGDQAFIPGTETLVYLLYDPYDFQVPYRIHLRPLDGSGPDRVLRELPDQNGYYIYRSFSQRDVSPDGRKLVYNPCIESGSGASSCPTTELQLLDLASGEQVALPLLGSGRSWSPDGRHIASIDRDNDYDEIGGGAAVTLYSSEGELERIVQLPRGQVGNVAAYRRFGPFPVDQVDTIYVYGTSNLSWSSSGRDLVASVEWGEDGNGYYAIYVRTYRIDVLTGEVDTIGWAEPVFGFYSYHVSTWDGSRWVERAEQHFGRGYTERRFDLSEFLPDPDGEYKVRIRQRGLQAAQVDRVSLRTGDESFDGVDHLPVAATLLDAPGDASVLDRVLGVDHEVLDLHEREIELRWDDVGGDAAAAGKALPVTLALVAREEPDLSARHPRPFSYPADDGRSYHLVAGGGAAMQVDGLQTGADGLEAPLFSAWSRPDTGHPAAEVYGYAASDADAVYAALDFTVDNTQDGDRDWGSLLVETPSGWREFRVTASDSTWGAVGFRPTGRAAYRHKYYEFRVPLAEVGARPGDTLAVRFQAYGTAALLDAEPDLLPEAGYGLQWLPGEDTVLYYSDYSGGNALIHLDDGNRVERVFDELTTLRDAYMSPSGRKLLFRDGKEINDPQSECYNSSSYADYSYFSFDSLANDAVELDGEPTPDGRGIELSGTATDLNFARWFLEYADESVPGFWTPIGEPETAPVVDDALATWVPPGPGAYLVRLTVEDRAGNRQRAVRRFSSTSATAVSITDLSVSPRYISPNGDGVQDSARLHYRVLAPVHLEVGVFDQAGDRVRTFRRDESVLGSEHDLIWDGRNDAGLPVADGLYSVEIQGYAFSVTVDTTAPAIDGVELLGPGQVVGGRNVPYTLELGPRVTWCASDLHPAPFGETLSIGTGAAPAAWQPIASAELQPGCPSQEAPISFLSLDQFVGHRFRLEVRDLAGNSAVAETPLAGEELLVYRFWNAAEPVSDAAKVPAGGVVYLDAGASARMRVAETSRGPLSRLFVQVRPSCPEGTGSCGGPWQDVEVDELYDGASGLPASTFPQPELELVWDSSFLDPSQPYDLRLRARAVDGQDVYSNQLRLGLVTAGIHYAGLVRSYTVPETDPDNPEEGASDLEIALGRAGLDPAVGFVLYAEETLDDPLTDVVLFVTSDEDPRFVPGRALPLAGSSGGVLVFDGSDLLPCHTYQGVVLARVVPADGSGAAPVESNHGGTRIPCLDLDAQGATVPAPQCGGTPDPVLAALFTPKSFDGVELTQLTVALDARDDVFFNVNHPTADQTYRVEIDTDTLDEGVHRIWARLTNGEGVIVERRGTFVVDRQAPSAELTYPLDGQRLCISPDEDGNRILSVEGRIEDVGLDSAEAILQRRFPGGDWPTFQDAGSGIELGKAPLLADEPATFVDPVVEDLSDPAGTFELRLTAVDRGNHRVCGEPVEVSIDGRVEGLSVIAESDLISPNGDDLAEEALLAYGSGEPVTFDVQVFHGVEKLGQFQTVVEPVGEPVRTLAAGLVSAGGGSLIWDGRGDGGGVVEDGLYAVVFQATDGCGNTTSLSRGVSVDTTPPQVEITAPTSGADLPLVVEVLGTATDPHFLDYRLDHGVGSEPFTWAPLERSNAQVLAARLGLWNTFGLQGPQTLRLTARDRAGNAAVFAVTVDLPVEDSLITDLQVVPDPVSPNGDGRRESATVRFGFVQEVTATLEVIEPGGAPVRVLAADETFPEGAALRTWDGLAETGQPVADGTYRVRLDAAATFDPSLSQAEELPIVVDSTPPTITVERPRQGFAAGTGTVLGTVADLHLAEYVVELTDTPELPDWREIARGDTAVTGGDLASLEGLEEGFYALRVSARDTAENRSERVIPFEVDNTPPEVALDAPTADSVVGGALGPVAVLGSAVEEHPASWTLELGAGEAPSSWSALASGDGAPPATLLSWQVGAVPDGLYVLRLTVEDLGGLQGEARVAIAVDNTPPAVAITSPAAGSFVTGPSTVTGTAADPHLLVYRIEVAPAGSAQWSEIGRAAAPVTAGILLSWQALPPDGDFQLRLRAEDRAGNAAEASIPLSIDTHPPAPPQGLTASLEGGADGHLSWQPNSEGDLAGYRVYRNGTPLTAQPVTGTSYADAALGEGSWTYTVTAVDRAGLESAPSASAELSLDHTPPLTLILEPISGASVSGLVDVLITASSSDFEEYRLTVAPVDGSVPAQLLRRSPTPVTAEVVTSWSTAGLPEGAAFRLRLEAEDVHGNLAVAETPVVIDNLGPAAPTGLTAAAASGDVALAWNANSETDLAGYLLYRDGRLIHGSGDDLVRRALTATSYDDQALPDGTFSYRLAAIDRAGNVSPLSAPATATLDLHAPHVEIERPDDGARFDSPLYVLATTPDRDLAEVRIEVRPVGTTEWTGIATPTAEPWETVWDPAGLEYGDFEIRAVARDAGGRVDPAPPVIGVTFTDLDRPEAVQGLSARVDGGDVHLSWLAAGEADLAGYFVDRTAAAGSAVRVTAEPVTGTSFVDTGLPDDTYTYRIVAVDAYDNEAQPSAGREAVVYTPELDRPLSPTRATSADLAGVVLPGSAITVEVTRPGGTETLPAPAVDGSGRFTVTGLAIERGTNTLAVVAEDGAGNRSKPGLARVIAADPPSVPTGLAATATDQQVELSWTLNPEPDILGYRVFDGGSPRLYEPSTRPSSATASSADSSAPAARAVDSSSYTWWSPDPTLPVDGQWLAATWSMPRLVSSVLLDWYGVPYRAIDYDVQLWDGMFWVTLAHVRGNGEETPEISLDDAYPTTGIRLVLHAIAGAEEEAQAVRLADLRFTYRQLTAQPPETFTTYEGLHDLSVSAVNGYGFESAPSDPIQVPVGDAEGPDPVTLTAVVDGSDVTLSWTESLAPDLRAYLVYRDGAQILYRSNLTNRTFVDYDLANGTYRYTVVARDQVGNLGPPSNEVEVTVAVPLPPAPLDLAVTDPGLGNVLDLAWSPGTGEPAATGYRVLRSTVAGGPYTTVAESATTTYRDHGLEAGTTYYYVVAGVDFLDNAGPVSNEASGTPEDRTGPRAAFEFPAGSGGVYRTSRTVQELIVGTTEAGVAVEVRRDGQLLVRTTATTEPETLSVPYDAYGTARPSPDGSLLLLDDYYGHELLDFATGEAKTIPGFGYTYAYWMSDGERLLGALYDYDTGGAILSTYRVEDGATETLALLESADVAVPSPDGRHAAVLGSDGPETGLLLVDLETGAVSTLVSGSTYQFDEESLAWSPDGSHLAYLRDAGPSTQIEIVEIDSGAVTAVPVEAFGYGGPSWSPDGTAIVFTGPDELTYGFWDQLWRYRVADGVAEQLTSDEEDHETPRWSPAGGSIAYVADAERLETLDLETGEVEQLYELADWSYDLAWVRGGQIVTLDGGQPLRITPAGRFEVHGVPLSVGENRFTATATDALGNRSAASDPMVIEVVTDGNANLSIAPDDLTILPAVPLIGQEVTFTATVRNTGAVESTPTVLDLVLLPPSGAPLSVGSDLVVNALAPAAGQSLTSSFTLPSVPGRWTLVATADPLDRVLEAREDDNRAERAFPVLADAGPAVFVATDRGEYSGGDDVVITADLANGGAAFTGALELTVEDADGYLVEALAPIPVPDLAAGSEESHQATWNTGAFFAGDYRVTARLVGDAGSVQAAGSAAFQIAADVDVSAAVTTDRALYDAGATVRITGTVRHESGNSTVTGLAVHIALFDAADVSLAEWTEDLDDLPPGSEASITRSWESVGAAPGGYRIELEVLRNGARAAGAATGFDLAAPAGAVTGSLSLSSRVPAVGTPLVASYQITNGTPQALAGLPIHLVVIESGDAAERARSDTTLDLDAGATTSASVELPTDGLALTEHRVLLLADLPAADGGAIETVTLAADAFVPADGTAPEIGPVEPADGAYVASAQPTLRAVVFDSLSRVDRVEMRLDGGAWQDAAVESASDGRWSRPGTGLAAGGLADGAHDFEIRATDAAGNEGLASSAFTVDTVAPEVTVTGVEDGGHYADPVAPAFEIVELHPGSDEATLDGAAFASGTEVSEPGEHALRIVAEDLAGNRTEVLITFQVGAGDPELVATKTAGLALDADGDGRPSPGDEIGYEITVANIGDGEATEVALSDPVPASASVVPGSVETTVGAVTGEGPVEVALGTVEAGDQARVTFRVRIDLPVAAGVDRIENQGVVTSAELPAVLTDDPELGGSEDLTVTMITAAPELVAEKTAELAVDADSDGGASPGDTLEYRVVVRNVGNTSATGVVLADPVPEHTAVVAGSVETDRGTVVSDDPVTVALGEIAGLDHAEVHFRVVIDDPIAAGVREVSNQGLVTSAELPDVVTDDPAVGGPADPTVTAITAAPVLRVEKEAILFDDRDGDGLASPDDELLYRLRITNTGNTPATAAVLTDPVPDHTVLEAGSVQTSRGDVTSEAPVTVDLGPLPVGEETTVSFLVRIERPFPLDVLEVANQASLATTELATVPSDDPATAAPDDPTVTEVFITPRIDVADAGAEEHAGPVVFTVSLSEPSNREVAVSYATAPGTAAAGFDYQAVSGRLVFAPGETEAAIEVPLDDDLLDELDETFRLVLTDASGAALGDGEGTATILDDDPPPLLSVADVTAAEGGDGAGASAVFTLRLSAPSGLPVSVAYATADGTAVAGTDYTAVAGQVTLPPGLVAATVEVPILGDAVDERDETFRLLVTDALNALVADGEAEATILDDDLATLSIDDLTIDEGDAPSGGTSDALFTVRLATPADREITVDYSTVEGSATAGVDFEPAAGTVHFAAGVTERLVAVAIFGDELLEPAAETFTVELANPVETEIGDGSAVGTIVDDELCPGPNLLANAGAEERPVGGELPGWSEVEGDTWQQRTGDPAPAEGAAYFFAGPTAFGELAQDVSVRAYEVRIEAPPAGEAGQAFAFSGRVRTFDEAPPDTARVVVEYRDASDSIVLDAFDSGEISSPDTWREVSDVRDAPAGTGWIRVRLIATRFAGEGDDGYFDQLSLRSLRAPVLSVGDATVYESGPGNSVEASPARFTIRLSCPFYQAVSASYATADGPGNTGAHAGEDYLAIDGSLTLEPGATEAEVEVPVLGDAVHEAHEIFTLNLADPEPEDEVVLLDPEGTGLILDDDFCARSHGFWKTHEELWPTDHLELGGVDYDRAELLAILSYHGPDAAFHLALQLVATKLDLLVGSDPYILPTVDEADELLIAFPPGSNPKKGDKTLLNQVKDLLDSYNNPSCEEDPVVP